MTGYLHPAYAESLSEFGRPQYLRRSAGQLLVRQIPQTDHADAMGCYPLFCCNDWGKLSEDLDELQGQLVSVALVTDPFGDAQTDDLRECFQDKMFHYKDHFVMDFDLDGAEKTSDHHRRNLDKALRRVTVERCDPISSSLEDWIRLYEVLIKRHQISGLAVFSRQSFERLFQISGVTGFRAIHNGETIGMLLWIEQQEHAYYHLGAYSERGYALGASFALFHAAIEHFRSNGMRALNLGAGAGIGVKQQDGLSRFKQGWSNTTKPVYFCGRIFDRVRYEKLVNGNGAADIDYFPAYRFGEFQG